MASVSSSNPHQWQEAKNQFSTVENVFVLPLDFDAIFKWTPLEVSLGFEASVCSRDEGRKLGFPLRFRASMKRREEGKPPFPVLGNASSSCIIDSPGSDREE